MKKKLSFEKDRIKVLLLEGIHKNAEDYFRQLGYNNVETHQTALDEAELVEKIKDTHLIGIRSRTYLTPEVLQHAPKLFAIGCFSIGTNQVELGTAKMMGIPVFNAPFSNTRSVAELVIAECIMLMRGISEKNIFAHQGKWKKTARQSYEIRGKNLGIIGYGHIGTQVSILAEALGMNIFYYDIEKKLSIGNAQVCETMDDLLEKSHILTLHVPSTVQTANMIGKAEISKLPEGAYLINAARGNVVDIDALHEALESGHIAGASIDVFPEEPASNNDTFKNKLQKFDNVILTPHIGGSTLEAQANIGLEVAEKLVKYSDNGSTLGTTNFVEIALRPNENKQRFLHIHRNLPGVLQEVNRVFSSRDVNIAAQYLQTDPEIGYIIIDIDTELERSVLDELRKIPHTIKTRMLY